MPQLVPFLLNITTEVVANGTVAGADYIYAPCFVFIVIAILVLYKISCF